MTPALGRGLDEQGVDIAGHRVVAIDGDVVDEDEGPTVAARGSTINVGVLDILGARPRERQRGDRAIALPQHGAGGPAHREVHAVDPGRRPPVQQGPPA